MVQIRHRSDIAHELKPLGGTVQHAGYFQKHLAVSALPAVRLKTQPDQTSLFHNKIISAETSPDHEKTQPTLPNRSGGVVFGSVFGALGGLFTGTLLGVMFTKNPKYVPLLGAAMVGGTALCACLGGGVGYVFSGQRYSTWRQSSELAATLPAKIANFLQF